MVGGCRQSSGALARSTGGSTRSGTEHARAANAAARCAAGALPGSTAGQNGRLLDAPTAIGAAALALLPEELRDARLNLCQPPRGDLQLLGTSLPQVKAARRRHPSGRRERRLGSEPRRG